MSTVLGIDTSSEELGIGLVKDGHVLGGVSFYVRNSHADQLAPAVNFLLQAHGVTPDRISAAGIAVGPGSFTGLRIGMAFLKGFLLGRKIPVLPLSSLESVALAWKPLYNSFVVAFDARRDQVFWARFRNEEGKVVRVTSDAVCSADGLASLLTDNETVLTDSVGNRQCRSFHAIAQRAHVYSVSNHPLQRGVACAMKASQIPLDSSRWIPSLDLTPQYLTASYVDLKKAPPLGG